MLEAEQIAGDLNGLLSPFLRRRRVAAVESYLLDRRRILEIGCGVFRWDGQLPPDAEYVGVDCEEAIIRHNRNHTGHRFILADMEKDDLSPCGTGFDLVLMLAVLEHYHDPKLVLGKLASLLSPEGIIAMTVPHPAGNMILSLGARFRVFAQDKDQHHGVANYPDLCRLAAGAGYEMVTYKRFLLGFNQLAILRRATNHEYIPA